MLHAVKALKCKPAKTWRGKFIYKYGRIDTTERLGGLEEIILKHQSLHPETRRIERSQRSETEDCPKIPR
jgi:hypothetical protein